MLRASSLLILAIAVLTTACGPRLEPQASCNFVQNSQQQRVSWKQSLPIPLSVHRSVPVEYHSAIISAAQHWEQVVGRDLFDFRGLDDRDGLPQKDGSSVIYWMPTWEGARSSEQARTTIYWVGTEIKEADMRVNARDFKFSAGDDPKAGFVDFESLIVHELGHVLGLQHNAESGSVMAESLASATFRRSPNDADVESLKCEY